MRKFESAQEETPHFGIQQNMWKKLIMGNLWEVWEVYVFFFQETISRKLGHPGSLDYFEFTLFMDGVLPSYRIKKSNMLCVCTLPSGYLTLPWYRWPIEIEILPIKIGDFPWLC